MLRILNPLEPGKSTRSDGRINCERRTRRLFHIFQQNSSSPASGANHFTKRDGNLQHGKPDFKCGAAFGAVVAGDLSLVVLDYAVGGAESEAGAFANRLGGVERIEDALGSAQAGAGGGKLDDHFVVFAPEGHLEAPAAHIVYC